ncbi:MAG: cytochrome c biogenesis protein CcsA [Alphaproteobacteria bacterium]|nr:cytochrome c biogenesis protein CcsA [Alphaproteobacteria bacterium]
MQSSALFGWSALLALLPAAILPWRRLGMAQSRDATFWAVTAVAAVGPTFWSLMLVADAWRTGFSVALWITIAVTMITFALVAALARHAWRLAPLLLPYLMLLALIALVWQGAPERPLATGAPIAWLEVHIAVSVATYALATLAAVAGLAVFLQERALKSRRPTALSHHLPSVADGEALLVRLLLAAGGVLLVGLLSGIALQYLESGRLLRLDHKTLLSLLSFAVIVGLLAAHYRTGVRGRRAARYVLLGYLLLTLAYPGVKFVKDIIIG